MISLFKNYRLLGILCFAATLNDASQYYCSHRDKDLECGSEFDCWICDFNEKFLPLLGFSFSTGTTYGRLPINETSDVESDDEPESILPKVRETSYWFLFHHIFHRLFIIVMFLIMNIFIKPETYFKLSQVYYIWSTISIIWVEIFRKGWGAAEKMNKCIGEPKGASGGSNAPGCCIADIIWCICNCPQITIALFYFLAKIPVWTMQITQNWYYLLVPGKTWELNFAKNWKSKIIFFVIFALLNHFIIPLLRLYEILYGEGE